MKKAMLCIAVGFLYSFLNTLHAQGCASTSRNPWQWPGQRNWVVATNMYTGQIVNTQTNAATDIGDAWNPVAAYEGCATISNDQGNLLFFSTGRSIQRPDATTIYSGLLQGNENGSVGNKGSASQGIIAIKHPLTPDRYYFFTTDDALSGTAGFNYAIIGTNGSLIQNSTRLGNYRTTEGVSATFHNNGIDIWVAVCESGSGNIRTYLITCAGVNAASVTSNVGIAATGDEERGGIAFSWDGTKLASGFGNTSGADRVRVYNFNNTTGALTFSNGIGNPMSNNGEFAYDITFSPDNSRVLVSTNQGTVYSLNATNGSGNIVSAGAGSHSAIEIGASGNLYRATLGSPLQRLTGNLNTGAALTGVNVNGTSCSRGLNTMFIPPTEEPDIQEVGPFCNTDPAVNLNTTWICSGLNAEDATNYPNAYSGPGITNAGTGQFNPATAGAGTHRIIFKRCNVDDTIFITVNLCQACPDTTLQNGGPICAGATLNLNTMKITTAAGTWTISNAPAGTPATITGTTFTTTVNTTPGNYTVRYTLNPDPGGTCPKFAERIIRVNALPIVTMANKSVCTGNTTTFNAGNFSTYAWTGPNNFTSTANPITAANAGTYNVTVTNTNGCQGTGSATLTVNALPTPTLTNQSSCPGGNATFNAGNFSSYAWTGPSGYTSTQNPITVNNAGTYSVTVTDANGCTGSTSATYNINTQITFTVANQTICAGASTTFNAGNYSTYSWTGPNGFTSVQNPITVNNAGTYNISVTDANGCSGTANTILSVNASPVVIIANQSVCTGASATFNAGNFTTYSWTGPNGFTSTQNPINTNNGGTYNVNVTDANGCNGTGSATLTINALPVVTLNNQSACSGGSATFNAGNFASYIWDGPNAFTSTQNPIITTNAGTYSVNVVDANGCQGSGSADFTITTQVTITIANQTICADTNASFNAGNYASYAWTGPNGFTSTQNPITVNESGTYSVNIIDNNNCTGSGSATLTVNALPTPNINDAAICKDKSHVFDAGNYATYIWSSGESTRTVEKNSAGIYSVTVTDQNGCSNSDDAELVVNSNPVINIGDDIRACEGTSFVIDAGPNGTIYQWSNGDNTQSISISQSGNYSVVVSDINGCKGRDEMIAEFIQQPTIDLGNDIDLCPGGSAQITAHYTPSGADVIWSTKVIAPFIVVNTTQTVVATAVNDDFCFAVDSIEVVVHENPIIENIHDTTVCFLQLPEGLNIDAGNNGVYYQWNNGLNGQSININKGGTYSVEVISDFECRSTDSVVITEDCPSSIFIPNALSPNDDGLNDVFTIKGENIYDYELWVFDRWGEMIFYSADMNNSWNGKKFNNMREAQIDVYVWKVNYKTWADRYYKNKIQEKVGTVTIIK